MEYTSLAVPDYSNMLLHADFSHVSLPDPDGHYIHTDFKVAVGRIGPILNRLKMFL